MSGASYVVERGPGSSCDRYLIVSPDGLQSFAAGSDYTAAEALRREFDRLRSLPRSPEGWPEGADAEGAELLAPHEFIGGGSVWCGNAYADADKYDWGGVPSGVRVVARRKPKPVTRDVRAWDLEPGMDMGDGRVVTEVCRGSDRKVRIHYSTATSFHSIIRNADVTVLVEDSDG